MNGIELLVNIELFPENKGGKYAPVFPGTGCSLFLSDGSIWHCLQEFTDREFAFSGESYKAKITFFDQIPPLELFYKGKDFKLLEGQLEIGSGIILEAKLSSNELNTH